MPFFGSKKKKEVVEINKEELKEDEGIIGGDQFAEMINEKRPELPTPPKYVASQESIEEDKFREIINSLKQEVVEHKTVAVLYQVKNDFETIKSFVNYNEDLIKQFGEEYGKDKLKFITINIT